MNKGFNVETRGCLLPYKNPEKQKEAMRKIMRDYREHQRQKKQFLQNRLTFLEWELERLKRNENLSKN